MVGTAMESATLIRADWRHPHTNAEDVFFAMKCAVDVTLGPPGRESLRPARALVKASRHGVIQRLSTGVNQLAEFGPNALSFVGRK